MWVKLRTTPEQRAAWYAKAEAKGVNFSELARQALDGIFECPSAAGIQSGVRAGLGIALLNGTHVTEDIEVSENLFPLPPDITFVARANPRSRSAPIKALVSEIAHEFRLLALSAVV